MICDDFYNHAIAMQNYQGGLQGYEAMFQNLAAAQSQTTSNAYLQGIGQFRPRYSVRAFAVPEWQRGWFYGHSEWAKIP